MNTEQKNFEYQGKITYRGCFARAVISIAASVTVVSGSLAGPTEIFLASLVAIYFGMVAVTRTDPAAALLEKVSAYFSKLGKGKQKYHTAHKKPITGIPLPH